MIRYVIRGEDGLCKQFSSALMAQHLDALYRTASDALVAAGLGTTPALRERLDTIVHEVDEAIETFVTTEGGF